MIKKIKRLIPENIKGPLKALIQSVRDDEFERYREKKKIVVALAGFYRNLGDMALTYAQKEFLKRNFPEYEIVLFPSTETYQRIKALKNICTNDDIITIIGGGNMDDLYISLENARRYIIKSFPNNKIISFPQTIAFSNTPKGNKRMQLSSKIYSKHKNLTIFARELKSFEVMKKVFPKNRVMLSPDIVLSLNKVEPSHERHGIIYCVRNDLEAYLSNVQRESLKRSISENFSEVTFTDTVNISLDECSPENYEKTLEKFWLTLKKSKVVVTDRLHAMIFCAITKTPCIVLPNSNHKIKGTYEQWLKELEYIKFIDEFDLDKITNLLRNAEAIDLAKCKELNLSDKFLALKQAISK